MSLPWPLAGWKRTAGDSLSENGMLAQSWGPRPITLLKICGDRGRHSGHRSTYLFLYRLSHPPECTPSEGRGSTLPLTAASLCPGHSEERLNNLFNKSMYLNRGDDTGIDLKCAAR